MGEIVVPQNRPRRLPVRAPVLNPQLPAGSAVDRGGEGLRPFTLLFTGAWIPGDDALKIGPGNYADLQNWRYSNEGLEGVQGYSAITSSALARPALRSGLHFRPVVAGVPGTILLVQAYNAGLTTSAVYQHLSMPPAAGNFEATALWTDSSGAGLGRFASVSDGSMVYTNGVDTTIWSGTRHRAAAFINYDDPSGTFRYDVTERLADSSTASSSTVTLVRDAGPAIWLLVGSTRPLQGIRLVVGTPNASASTTTVEYWSGSAWVAVSGLSDGTAVGGVTLAQTGELSFTSTASVARVFFADDRLLYFYRLKVGATGTPDAGITLTGTSVNPAFQAIVDIWDGVERSPVACFVDSVDYTLEILDPSTVEAPIGAVLTDLVAGGAMLLGFEEQTTGLQIRMVGNNVNTTAALVLTVKYWNGTAWTSVSGLADTTDGAVGSFERSGSILWSAPASTSEYAQTLFGRTAFFYQLTWDLDMPGPPEIIADTVTGIPAQRWNAASPIPGYLFPFMFGGRVMLAGASGTNELNRIDYSAPQRPDVWNGEESSSQGRQIYVGDDTPLTSAIEMSNRFASNATALALLHKSSETWVLQGTAPENFILYRMTADVGNPAPLSLALAEVPFAVDQQAVRSVAIWCSADGPVMSEGSVVVLMRFAQPDGRFSGVETFFRDQAQVPAAINPAAFANVRGWYDPHWKEYNLLIPSGAGQTTCNLWLCCDLLRRRWYKKVPTVYPQMVTLLRDTVGVDYLYGGLDTGHLVRLEDGPTWDGTGITRQLTTADVPYQEGLWSQTVLRYLKVALVRDANSSGTVTVAHAGDGSATFTTQATLTLNTGSGRYVKLTTPLNLKALTHQWRLTTSALSTEQSPQLLGLSALFRVEREELTS